MDESISDEEQRALREFGLSIEVHDPGKKCSGVLSRHLVNIVKVASHLPEESAVRKTTLQLIKEIHRGRDVDRRILVLLRFDERFCMGTGPDKNMVNLDRI